MRVTYYYTEYQNCPEATRISKSRSKSQLYQGMLCITLFLISLLTVGLDSKDRWLSICGIIICPIWLIYLFTYYNKVTDKKIKEAIECQKRINERKQKKNILVNNEKLSNVKDSNQTSLSVKIEKPPKEFLLVGKDISTGYHKFSAPPKTSGFVIIYPPNTNQNDETGRIQVFKNTSVHLKDGYSIVLENCVLVQKDE